VLAPRRSGPMFPVLRDDPASPHARTTIRKSAKTYVAEGVAIL